MCLALLGLLGAGAGAAGGAAAGTAAAGGAAAASGASALSTLATLAGTGLSVAGALSQGQAAQDVANYNAQVARNNASAEQQRAAYEAGITRDRVRGIMAQQRAGYASSGLDPRSGTPVTVLGDTAKQGELDVMARLYAGQSAATAYRNDAARFQAEGAAAKSAAKIGAMTSLVGGIGKLASGGSTSAYKPLSYGGPQYGGL